MIATRRRFLLFAAPAIVAAPSLMRVSAAVLEALDERPFPINAEREMARSVTTVWLLPAGSTKWEHHTLKDDGSGGFTLTLPGVGDQALVIGSQIERASA